MENLIKNAKEKQIGDLKRIIQALDDSHQENAEWHVIEFSKADLSDDGIDKLAECIPKTGKYLYFFTTDSFKGLPEAFQDAQSKNREIKFTRLNRVVDDSQHNEQSVVCLYVGSSNHLSQRFKSHCGKVAAGTYAIKFSYWLSDNIPIKFFYREIAGDNVVLQNIEDGLWELKQTVFGKKGGKL